jgi:[ribosomal protein S5]-alanine N-acetyltransferase
MPDRFDETRARMTVILQTERLIVRTWSPEDEDDGYRIWSDPEVMRYVGTGQPNASLEETRAWVGRMTAHHEAHGFGFWAVVEKKSNQLIGNCGMGYQRDGGLPIEFGYTLARSHWGRGYATEAAAACLRYAFESLRFTELSARVDSRNVASQRVLEKIGFVYQREEQLADGIDFCYVARDCGASSTDNLKRKTRLE